MVIHHVNDDLFAVFRLPFILAAQTASSYIPCVTEWYSFIQLGETWEDGILDPLDLALTKSYYIYLLKHFWNPSSTLHPAAAFSSDCHHF